MSRKFMLFLFLILVASSSKAQYGQLGKYKDLKFIFNNGLDVDGIEFIQLNETSQLLVHPDFKNNRPTMLYCFGYTEKYSSQSTQTVVNSYIERGDHNILVVEWSEYNGNRYIAQAIVNSYAVGDIVGKVLWHMRSEGFNLETFHLVGHSLGGHLVGFIGRSYIESSGNTTAITRISALDPAGPLFYGFGSQFNKPLNQNDAYFVDVIHTDYNFFGASDPTGDADFWPNEGKDQPECPPANLNVYNEDNFCSHRRSWHMYSESVRSFKKTFDCVKCDSWESFKEHNCSEPDDGVPCNMGFYADPRLRGDFYLQTNYEEPYDRGQAGTVYEEYD